MKRVLVGHDQIVGPWVCSRTGGTWVKGQGTTIGLMDVHKGIVAGVNFEDYNGANVCMHVASSGDRNWLNRDFLWFCFYYPFEQLKVRRVTALVSSTNVDCLRFVNSLGFIPETALKDAAPDGDLTIHAMFRHQCRWLALKDRHHGKQGLPA